MNENKTKTKSANGVEKKSYMTFVSDFFKEIKKVIWPTPRMTFKNTGITLVAVILVGTYVWMIDLGLKELLRKVMEISS